ncbi:hypothetical protein EV182_005349, partial [Spiromyces aspiralis]
MRFSFITSVVCTSALVALMGCVPANAAPSYRLTANTNGGSGSGHYVISQPASHGSQQDTTSADENSSSGNSGSGSSSQGGGMSQDDLNKMLCIVNQRRAQSGKAPLSLQQNLIDSAQAHSNYQQSINQMTHDDPRGGLGSRIEAAGFPGWTSVAENVAAGQTSVESVMDAWLGSSGHLENILGDFEFCGFGRSGNMWTQEFAAASSPSSVKNILAQPSSCSAGSGSANGGSSGNNGGSNDSATTTTTAGSSQPSAPNYDTSINLPPSGENGN